MIKNPYLWIDSLFRFEENYNYPSMKCYLENNDLDNLKTRTIEFINYWNKIYSNYKEYIINNKAHLIKYENILEDYVKILNELKSKYNLVNKNNSYNNEKYTLKANNDKTIKTTYNYKFDKKDYYLNPESINKLPKIIITTINNFIDKDLMKFYGYDIIKLEE